jgi:hypothetical protein
MKTYVKPMITDVSLGTYEIDGTTHEVVGIVPFLVAAAAAVAAAATSVGKAVEAFDDHHIDYQHIESINEVEA